MAFRNSILRAFDDYFDEYIRDTLRDFVPVEVMERIDNLEDRLIRVEEKLEGLTDE